MFLLGSWRKRTGERTDESAWRVVCSMVGAISQAAFTDGLASAQGHTGPAPPQGTAMDAAMLSEVHRTAQKIGGDIGDGVSVAHTALADMLLDVFEGDTKTLCSVEKILS
jgi:hypothetical protein